MASVFSSLPQKLYAGADRYRTETSLSVFTDLSACFHFPQMEALPFAGKYKSYVRDAINAFPSGANHKTVPPITARRCASSVLGLWLIRLSGDDTKSTWTTR